MLLYIYILINMFKTFFKLLCKNTFDYCYDSKEYNYDKETEILIDPNKYKKYDDIKYNKILYQSDNELNIKTNIDYKLVDYKDNDTDTDVEIKNEYDFIDNDSDFN